MRTSPFLPACLLFLSLWISKSNGNDSSQMSCPFPSKLKNYYDYDWRSRQNEWSNTRSPTDYFLLSLSWTPTFCSSLPSAVSHREFQCSRSDAFGLVVHGLWPQTAGASSVRDQPRNCRNDDQLPSSVIRRYYCLMPDEDLMQAEWEKHGSCYFKSALDYFQTIESLFLRLNLPDVRSMTRPSAASIKNAFLQSNAPQLFSSSISVKMNSQGQLEEIHLCYDLQYRFISCVQR